MMYESRNCMFPLFSAIAGLLSVSGSDITVKYVCKGDSVQAFQNIELNRCNSNISLTKINYSAQLAVWSIQNCSLNDNSLLPEYQGRLNFDLNGTITIKNFDHSDQAVYIVKSYIYLHELPKIYEVNLSLMVAPTKACKPIIEKLENSLETRVNRSACGEPKLRPYWKDYDTDVNTNGTVIKLTPGTEAKIYYACIEGDALKCVKNVTSDDYCSTFTTGGKEEHQSEVNVTGKSPPASSETNNANAHIIVCIILIILVSLGMLALAVIFIRYHPRKKNVNDEQMPMLLETPKPWTNEFGKLNWEEIRKLLNDDQQMGLQTYCDNLKTQNDNSPPQL